MSVPAKRKSAAKKKRGQSHNALRATKLNSCPKCNQPMRPHQACPSCGYYKGREVVKK